MTSTLIITGNRILLPGDWRLEAGVDNGLIRVKEEGWMGFSEGWQGCSKEFPEENLKEQPCQPKETSVLSDSFTQIYILFPTRFFKVLRSAGE